MDLSEKFICILFIGLSSLLVSACHDEAALKQALIEETIANRIQTHISKKRANCRKEIIKAAVLRADSLMIQLALSKTDTSSKNTRPIKPTRPTIIFPTDTTPIKPLFEELTPQADSLSEK